MQASWEPGRSLPRLLCLMVSAEISRQSCPPPPPPSHSRGPSGVTEQRSPPPPTPGNRATENKVQSEKKREHLALGPGITFTHVLGSIINNPEFPEQTLIGLSVSDENKSHPPLRAIASTMSQFKTNCSNKYI